MSCSVIVVRTVCLNVFRLFNMFCRILSFFGSDDESAFSISIVVNFYIVSCGRAQSVFNSSLFSFHRDEPFPVFDFRLVSMRFFFFAHVCFQQHCFVVPAHERVFYFSAPFGFD